MTLDDFFSLELLWDALLSHDPERIMDAYKKLHPDDRPGILMHLERMTSEEGWHIEQIQSARVALEVIHRMSVDDPE
jgi:hypothetical protein